MTTTRQLTARQLYDAFTGSGVQYFSGVPDSITSPFSFYLESHHKKQHVIAANEGNAVGLAIGYHVATGKVPLVYMQNSGFSNAIDPLVSLVDSSVMSIPMILLISWRGQPGKKDEPQHKKQGAITTAMLDTVGIPYVVIAGNSGVAKQQVSVAVAYAIKTNTPYALLLQKDTLEEYISDQPATYTLSREEALVVVIKSLADNDIIVSGIGKISRELYEYRESNGRMHHKDLLIVGGMGHASSVAMAVSQQKPGRRVYCLDGDGSVLMHMGALATIGTSNLPQFCHIIFNNGVHDSVGGQPTAGFKVNFPAIARACGYKYVVAAHTANDITNALSKIKTIPGPILLEIRIHSGARAELTRPKIHPGKNKDAFMEFVK